VHQHQGPVPLELGRRRQHSCHHQHRGTLLVDAPCLSPLQRLVTNSVLAKKAHRNISHRLAKMCCPSICLTLAYFWLHRSCLLAFLSLPLCKVASDFDRLNDQAAKHITHMRKAAEIVQDFKQELLKLTSRRVSSSVVVGGNQSATSALETAQSLAQVYLCDLFVVLLTVLQIDVSVLPLHKFSPKFILALLCGYIRIPSFVFARYMH